MTCVISKPILACDLKNQWDKLTYPMYGSAKLDGIRCTLTDAGPVSRTFKPIPNNKIRETLKLILPVGADGEIIVGSNFQDCTHGVMSVKEDNIAGFKYYMFDLVSDLNTPYLTRIENLKKWYETLTQEQQNIVQLVLPTKLNSKAEVEAYEQKCLDEGFEGVILRSGTSPYKCGRSTLKEQYLIKIKRFEDAEAEVVGFEELMTNNNVATKDNFGRSERSSHKENLSGAGVLGTLLVKDLKTNETFGVGSGFSAAQRKQYWEGKDLLIGQIIKYKYFSVGIKDKPRHPIWLGFRNIEDMGE